jgi:hypothetical protein
MIQQSGWSLLLNAQRTYLSGLYWTLFTNNVGVTALTAWTDLVEAAWSGYVRIIAGPWNTPTIVGPRAQVLPAALPTFQNTGASAANFYGWGLLDASSMTLVAAANLGPLQIPAGGNFALSPAVTDTEE